MHSIAIGNWLKIIGFAEFSVNNSMYTIITFFSHKVFLKKGAFFPGSKRKIIF